MEIMSTDEELWILRRIDFLETLNSPRRLPTHRNIWSGSYDVWACEQDRIDAQDIPKARMDTAVKNMLIESRPHQVGKYTFDVWTLTERGKQLIGK